MKKLLLVGVALSALVAGPAMAADLPVRAPVYKSAPASSPDHSLRLAAAMSAPTSVASGRTRSGTTLHRPGSADSPTAARPPSSWVAGVQGGCNYQFAGGFVIGIQGDYDWTDAGVDRNSDLLCQHRRPASGPSRLRHLPTGRFGYGWDRFLLYVKGGGAWERDELTFAFPAAIVTFSDTRNGWTVGIGGEYAFTNWLTGFVEYDYYSFGTHTVNFPTVVPGLPPGRHQGQQERRQGRPELGVRQGPGRRQLLIARKRPRMTEPLGSVPGLQLFRTSHLTSSVARAQRSWPHNCAIKRLGPKQHQPENGRMNRLFLVGVALTAILSPGPRRRPTRPRAQPPAGRL